MAETWTEYAVRATNPDYQNVHDYYAFDTRFQAEMNAHKFRDGTVVGRTVTASDWLPVDQGGAS